ncbi:stage II sporulation protein [Rhodococcus sp. WMMA185]|uniref:SpoIID/LytB domain-containing protein n=1 Tax=Rhodococcus sp. WMMA185 TaxID=679318 RepID=UPI000878C3A5|nr:SpoIID/LytB domain-containing protein [Rhodococcus sp. WMMA185]AOW93800.1 stage II sporulation protein [Rhodococcus sp. WMMA185]
MARHEFGVRAGRQAQARGRRYIARPTRTRGWKSSLLRLSALGIAPAFVAVAVTGVVAQLPSTTPKVRVVVASDAPFTISGHGNGHGRGMGQWGAYGYAKDHGWGAERILAHYYGGTTLGTLADAQISVRLQARDDQPLGVYSDVGAVVAGRPVGPGDAVHLTPTTGGGANVVVTRGCAGDVLWQDATDHPWVDPIDLGPDRPVAEHLKLCAGDTPYRGALGAALDDGATRTVNVLAMDDYLLGVLPLEVKANWADTGGAEALRAQAVAARSYAAAENREEYARTCDTKDCQIYGGSANEDPRTTDAVRSTEGMILTRDNKVVAAEFSSSTGGHTAGGEFPAVVDLGDTASPYHDWTVTLTAGDIASAFEVGELESFEVLSRNNFGDEGGRATAVKVVGSEGVAEVTGLEARSKLNLRSDWFTVGPGGGVPDSLALVGGPEPAIAGSEYTGTVGTTRVSPIAEKYEEVGGANGTLGAPVGPEMMLPADAGTFRTYEGGTIIYTETLGARVVDANVLREWVPEEGS